MEEVPAVDVNNEMVKSRAEIKRAKVRVINKMVRNIRILKKKRLNLYYILLLIELLTSTWHTFSIKLQKV